MENKQKYIYFYPEIEVKEYFIKDEKLFGLLKYERVLLQEKVGEKLEIAIDKIPNEVYINQIRYIPEIGNISQ
jgi:hypothetical protein